MRNSNVPEPLRSILNAASPAVPAEANALMKIFIKRIAGLEALSGEALEDVDEERLFSEACALAALIREARVIMGRIGQ